MLGERLRSGTPWLEKKDLCLGGAGPWFCLRAEYEEVVSQQGHGCVPGLDGSHSPGIQATDQKISVG